MQLVWKALLDLRSDHCPGSDFGLASSPSHQSPLIPTLHSFPISHISVTWRVLTNLDSGYVSPDVFCQIPASRHLANGWIITSDCCPLRQSSLPNHPGSQTLVSHWVNHRARHFKHEVIRLMPWLYQQELSMIFPFLLFMSDDAILFFRLVTFLIFTFTLLQSFYIFSSVGQIG